MVADKSTLAWLSLDRVASVSLPQFPVSKGTDAVSPDMQLSARITEKAFLHRSSPYSVWASSGRDARVAEWSYCGLPCRWHWARLKPGRYPVKALDIWYFVALEMYLGRCLV